MASNKIIALTGCTRGLGRALVSEFAARGHVVAGCGRSKSGIAELQQEIHGASSFTALDVCDEHAVAQWARVLIDQFGAPDLLINNAAMINQPAPLWDVSRVEFQELVALNLVAVHTVIRHLLPAMIEQGEGIVINLSSGWGRSVSADVAPYCASKWAIEGMTKALSEELPPGLAAIPLSPGVIDTDMLRQAWGDGAGAYRTAEQWAVQAAPFMLELTVEHNGQSLTTPG